jgi:hypothetical protein
MSLQQNEVKQEDLCQPAQFGGISGKRRKYNANVLNQPILPDLSRIGTESSGTGFQSKMVLCLGVNVYGLACSESPARARSHD